MCLVLDGACRCVCDVIVGVISVALAGLGVCLLWLDSRGDVSRSGVSHVSTGCPCTVLQGSFAASSVVSFRESLAAIVRYARGAGSLTMNERARWEYAYRALPRIEWKLDAVLDYLGVILSDQEHLDTEVASLVSATQGISDEIAALKAQPAAAQLDFTNLDAAVAAVQGLVPAPVVPADPGATGA